MNLSAVLLAAGASTRFGADKRMLPLPGGERMLSHAARQMRAVIDDVVVVLRPDDTEIANAMLGLDCRVTVNPEPARGMGSSLALGIGAARQADGWLVIPGDLPLVRTQTICAVAARLQLADAVVPVCHGRRGHPVGFGRRYRDRLLALNGEAGGRQLLNDHDESIVWFNVDDPGIHRDIDTRADERMRLRLFDRVV